MNAPAGSEPPLTDCTQTIDCAAPRHVFPCPVALAELPPAAGSEPPDELTEAEQESLWDAMKQDEANCDGGATLNAAVNRILTDRRAHYAAALEREKIADWLGDMDESRNVFDYTDEATTVITIDVETLADRIAARLGVHAAALEDLLAHTEHAEQRPPGEYRGWVSAPLVREFAARLGVHGPTTEGA